MGLDPGRLTLLLQVVVVVAVFEVGFSVVSGISIAVVNLLVLGLETSALLVCVLVVVFYLILFSLLVLSLLVLSLSLFYLLKAMTYNEIMD